MASGIINIIAWVFILGCFGIAALDIYQNHKAKKGVVGAVGIGFLVLGSIAALGLFAKELLADSSRIPKLGLNLVEFSLEGIGNEIKRAITGGGISRRSW